MKDETVPGPAYCLLIFAYYLLILEAMKGLEPLSTGLQDRRSGVQLSYIAMNMVDWEGFKPSQEVCRTSMLSFTSPARKFLVATGGVEPPT